MRFQKHMLAVWVWTPSPVPLGPGPALDINTVAVRSSNRSKCHELSTNE